MVVHIKQLGLAAFVRMRGAKLLQVEGKVFVFESDMTVTQWKAAYMNSECQQHDALVCELRDIVREGYTPPVVKPLDPLPTP